MSSEWWSRGTFRTTVVAPILVAALSIGVAEAAPKKAGTPTVTGSSKAAGQAVGKTFEKGDEGKSEDALRHAIEQGQGKKTGLTGEDKVQKAAGKGKMPGKAKKLR